MKKRFLIIFLLVIFMPLHAENNMIFVEGGEMILGYPQIKLTFTFELPSF